MPGSELKLPWRTIETLFLDVGNTLVSINHALAAENLSAEGLACTPQEFRRAEAAARPEVSRRVAENGLEGAAAWIEYLAAIVARLPSAMDLGDAERRTLAERMAPRLQPDGAADRLWNAVIPGVAEALRDLRSAGKRLVAVSNSDGTAAKSLGGAGLLDLLDHVVDSRLVGVEKPHPEIFRRALEISGAEPATTVHLGDLYDIDVVGARAAGLHAALIDPYGDWDVDCPRVRDVPEVRDLILGTT